MCSNDPLVVVEILVFAKFDCCFSWCAGRAGGGGAGAGGRVNETSGMERGKSPPAKKIAAVPGSRWR